MKKLFFSTILFSSLSIYAQWSVGGTQFSTSDQHHHLMKCSSGTNGELYTTWIALDTTGKVMLDARDHFGNQLPGWPVGGMLISDTVGDYWKTEIVTSEDNLPIVVWYGYETVNTGSDRRHIFIQKFDQSGNALWNGGNPIRVSQDTTVHHMNPTVISNGNGGAFVAWIQTSLSLLPSDNDLFVEHIDSSGNIHSGWPSTPVALANQPGINESYVQLILSENKNNLYVEYSQGSISVSLYLQNLDPATGNFKSGFTINVPKLISPGTNIYQNGGRVPQLFTNSSNEFIILWVEFRGAGELYMQRMDTTGTNLLTANGVTVYTNTGDDMTYFDCFMNKNTNEIFYAFRINIGAYDYLHANKCNMNGVPIWGSDFVTTTQYDYYPKVIDDSHDGMYMVWKQGISNNLLQFVRLNPDGTVNVTTAITGTNIGLINNYDGFNPHLDFQITTGVSDLVHVVWNKRLGDNLYDVFGCNFLSNGYVCVTTYVLGMEEETYNETNVYPNPTNSIVHFPDHGPGIYSYKAYTMDGRFILGLKMEQEAPQANIGDILAPGIYYVELTYMERSYFYKVIVVE